MSKVKESASDSNYKVLHHLVGPWPRGHVLTQEDMTNWDKTVDIDRLVQLEAIEPTDEDVTGPAPAGPENRQILVDSVGRVLDAPGHDRPDVRGRVMTPKGHESARRDTAQRAGLHPDTLQTEGEPEEAEEDENGPADNRSRPGAVLKANQGSTGSEYESMKVAELRQVATDRGIDPAGMTKPQLINALVEDDGKSG